MLSRRFMTHYERLGVATSASRDEIKRAYRLRAIDAHPDRHPAKHGEFALINNAKEILLDADKRRDYDVTLKLALNEQSDEVKQSQMHWHRSADYKRPVYNDEDEINDDEDDFFVVLNNEHNRHIKTKPLKFVKKKKSWF